MDPQEIYCELRALQRAHRRLSEELTDTQRKLARADEIADVLLDRLRAERKRNESSVNDMRNPGEGTSVLRGY
jgi:hypothetical protein